MKKIYFCFTLFFLVWTVGAQTSESNTILLKNVRIFNGVDNKTPEGSLLIEGHKITQVSTGNLEEKSHYTVIDGQGKYVIPGLIDAHTHLTYEGVSFAEQRGMDVVTENLIAVNASKARLLRGFTTVRNMGGNVIPLAKAIDKGIIDGPRVYPSGAFISQTGGHGDSGLPTDVPRIPSDLSYGERNGHFAIADGVPEVLRKSREQLRQGATQLKVMAGGGVSSEYDPIDVLQYSPAEFEATVLAAENWGTYVGVHVYTPQAIIIAVNAGVKSIEHGNLMDEKAAKLMAEKGVWWSAQPFMDDEDNYPGRFPEGTFKDQKMKAVWQGTDNAYKLAKKYGIKTAFGTDIAGSPVLAAKAGKILTKLSQWYEPFEILRMATSENAKLLALSGPRNPYRDGELGKITEGAYADLILVDGNPLENIDLVADPEKNFLLIMKDGKIYKNTLTE